MEKDDFIRDVCLAILAIIGAISLVNFIFS